VGELGELDLQLALVAAGTVGEDMQDQLGAGHGPAAQAFLEIALLPRRQVVVDDQEVGVVGGECVCELCELSLAHVPARVRRGAARTDAHDDVDAGAACQLGTLVGGPENLLGRTLEGDAEKGRAAARFRAFE
jgi:hypothetical protein